MIKKYVVSLELAKRMDKLGWKKKTTFAWCKDLLQGWMLLPQEEAETYDCLDGKCYLNAPLFAEIWEELPYTIESYDLLIIKNRKNEIIITYYDEARSKYIPPSKKPFYNINPAEAAGEMWCWLVENKYLEV